MDINLDKDKGHIHEGECKQESRQRGVCARNIGRRGERGRKNNEESGKNLETWGSKSGEQDKVFRGREETQQSYIQFHELKKRSK